MENTGEEKKQNTGTEDNIESSKCDRGYNKGNKRKRKCCVHQKYEFSEK